MVVTEFDTLYTMTVSIDCACCMQSWLKLDLRTLKQPDQELLLDLLVSIVTI